MSWESSIEYERILNTETRARLGGTASADLLVRSYDFAQIERLQAAGDWQQAGDLLTTDASLLEAAGAEAIVLCTNTMHTLADQIAAGISIPLLHLADATADAVLAHPAFSTPLLLGSTDSNRTDSNRTNSGSTDTNRTDTNRSDSGSTGSEATGSNGTATNVTSSDSEFGEPSTLAHAGAPEHSQQGSSESITVALLGTRYTMEQDFYRARLESRGLTVLVPDEPDRTTVHDVIYDELVRGEICAPSKAAYLGIIERLVERGATGIIAGCTEIELLISQQDLVIPLFPTARIHALHAVEWSLR